MAIELTTASPATLSSINNALGNTLEEVLGFTKICDITRPSLTSVVATNYAFTGNSGVFIISPNSGYILGYKTMQSLDISSLASVQYFDLSKFVSLRRVVLTSMSDLKSVNLANSLYLISMNFGSCLALTAVNLPLQGLNYIETSTGTGVSVGFSNCSSLSANELSAVFVKLPNMGGRSAIVNWSGTAARNSSLSSTLVDILTSKGYTSVS